MDKEERAARPGRAVEIGVKLSSICDKDNFLSRRIPVERNEPRFTTRESEGKGEAEGRPEADGEAHGDDDPDRDGPADQPPRSWSHRLLAPSGSARSVPFAS